jgi:hypothetical protein
MVAELPDEYENIVKMVDILLGECSSMERVSCRLYNNSHAKTIARSSQANFSR